ncbi:MAG TPA: PAS domain S-box protein, partial [Thermoleophilaceae bacterium]|nr:PAS domain S-box protein [Thermoleophilaceae bacterium]
VVEVGARFADRDGPEAPLADAEPLPERERDGLEPFQEGRQAARDAEALRRELDATSGAVNQLGEEVRASRDADRSEALQAELEETRGSLERLEAELADGRVRYETLARLESELADLRATSPALDGVQHELEGLQREVTELRAQALQAGDTQPADEARDLLAELRGELAVLSTRAEKSQGSAEARLRELEAQRRQAAAEAAQQADTARQAALDVQRDAARAEEGAGQAREATRSAQELSEQALERAESAATASAAAGARQTEELTARLDEARAAIDQATTAAAERVEGIASTNLALAAERSSAADSQVSGVGDAASAAQASALQAEQAVGASEQALAEMRALAERIETGLAATERAAGLAGEQAEQATAAAALARAASEEAALETTIARKQAVAAQGSAVEAGRYAVSSRAPGPMPTVNVARDKKLPMFGKPASAGPARKPKLGFDDAPLPMAAIGLDGRFLELNPPFAQLVGYGEQEFRAATWPPVVDRPNLPKHRDQMRSLLEGEIESARVDTAYLHAQGLLVPVKGQLTLARDDDGKPKLFMLQIDEGAAAGS